MAASCHLQARRTGANYPQFSTDEVKQPVVYFFIQFADPLFKTQLFESFSYRLEIVMKRARTVFGAFTQAQTALAENFPAINGLHNGNDPLIPLPRGDVKSAIGPLRAFNDIFPGEFLQEFANCVFVFINIVRYFFDSGATT
jgi:hypothetical protein